MTIDYWAPLINLHKPIPYAPLNAFAGRPVGWRNFTEGAEWQWIDSCGRDLGIWPYRKMHWYRDEESPPAPYVNPGAKAVDDFAMFILRLQADYPGACLANWHHTACRLFYHATFQTNFQPIPIDDIRVEVVRATARFRMGIFKPDFANPAATRGWNLAISAGFIPNLRNPL